MIRNKYIVIEGTHKNPNKLDTLVEKSKKIYGPYNEKKANEIAQAIVKRASSPWGARKQIRGPHH